MLWNPYNNIKEDEINQFIIIARSVGTFARALDCSSSVKQPSLHMSAAAASRDITVFHAYQVNIQHRLIVVGGGISNSLRKTDNFEMSSFFLFLKIKTQIVLN